MPSQPAADSSPSAGAERPDEARVLEEIRRIARQELELEREVQPADDLLADLQLDSMALIVLAVGVENRFRVKLSEADAVAVRTVGELAALVVQRAEEAGP
jgi:acyl carrier protein